MAPLDYPNPENKKVSENSAQLSQVYLLWYKNLPIKNALWGAKIGTK